MSKEFTQIDWDEALHDDCRQIVRLAIREDLDRTFDWTTVALVPADAQGRAVLVARQEGVVAGLPTALVVIDEMDSALAWSPRVDDGAVVEAGTVLADVTGPARDLLTAERLILNFIGRLAGIATLTRRYVEAVRGTEARIYDTRKTTPGWRRLEKYAVRCGGGLNHRLALFEAVLIKDNHLAFGAGTDVAARYTPAEAVVAARRFVRENLPGEARGEMMIEVEVDSLEQLDQVLPAEPDIVLLDNMTTDQLREAVARRDRVSSAAELEASGGVSLNTVSAIADTGVERISVGALTHSASSLDIALDWLENGV